MARMALQKLLQQGVVYTSDATPIGYLVIEAKSPWVRLLELTSSMITALESGVTQTQIDNNVANASYYPVSSTLVQDLIANNIDTVEGAVFTFQNDDTVPISQNGFDPSAYSIEDQANYQVVRDLFVLLCG